MSPRWFYRLAERVDMIEGVCRGLGLAAQPFTFGTDVPLFRADWENALFVHFRIDPAALQRDIPFELDLYEGWAWVSLVAFTQCRFRLRRGGAIAGLLCRPLARHEFLNLRTYVRHRGRPGVCFITEWISNRPAVLLGPRVYGLPYQLGRMNYRCHRRNGLIEVKASAARAQLHCRARFDPKLFSVADPGSLEEFLLERYAAFTAANSVFRCFQIDHAPWPQQRVHVEMLDASILRLGGRWHKQARLSVAHFSPGVSDVSIAAPVRV